VTTYAAINNQFGRPFVLATNTRIARPCSASSRQDGSVWPPLPVGHEHADRAAVYLWTTAISLAAPVRSLGPPLDTLLAYRHRRPRGGPRRASASARDRSAGVHAASGSSDHTMWSPAPYAWPGAPDALPANQRRRRFEERILAAIRFPASSSAASSTPGTALLRSAALHSSSRIPSGV